MAGRSATPCGAAAVAVFSPWLADGRNTSPARSRASPGAGRRFMWLAAGGCGRGDDTPDHLGVEAHLLPCDRRVRAGLKSHNGRERRSSVARGRASGVDGMRNMDSPGSACCPGESRSAPGGAARRTLGSTECATEWPVPRARTLRTGTGTQVPCSLGDRRFSMAFRISRELGALTTIRLAGRLAGDAVDVLVGECGDAAADLTIDLSEVYYADEAGVQALGALRARGAILRRPRPYLAMLLEQGAKARDSDRAGKPRAAAPGAPGR